MKTKAEIEQEYNLPVYCYWRKVPSNLKTKTTLKRKGIKVPDDAEPDAIKGGGRASMKAGSIFLLYDENRFKP